MTPPVQSKFKRRRISAVRSFPAGCGPLSRSIPVVQTPPLKIEPMRNHHKDEAEESNGSTPPERESKEDSILEASGESHVGWDRLGFLEASKIFGVPKRREVSAVRSFPVGVSRISRRTREASVTADSSESKVGSWIAKEEGEEEVNRGSIVIGKKHTEEDAGRGNIGIPAFESPVKDVENECVEEGGEDEDIKLLHEKNVRSNRGKAVLDDDEDEDVRNIDVSDEDYFENLNEMDEVLEPVPIRERVVKDFGDELRFKSVKPRNPEAGDGVKSQVKRPLEAYKEMFIMPKLKVNDKLAPQNDGNRRVVAKKSVANALPKLKSIPSGPSKLNRNIDNSSCASPREMVKRALRLFQKLVNDDETKKVANGRADTNAATILKKNNKCVNNDAPIVGDVPGILVGDVFHYRVELAIVGLHRVYQAGIDYMKRSDGKIIATSIVASGGYPDDLERSGELIYSGSGGNADPRRNKEAEDQKLERGNLALKNSVGIKNPVRVIYGSKDQNKSTYNNGRAKTTMNFTYDGLYVVEDCWSEKGPNGFLVYKYRLRRLPRAENAQRDSDSDRE